MLTTETAAKNWTSLNDIMSLEEFAKVGVHERVILNWIKEFEAITAVVINGSMF
jgi:hypothetical protein